MSYKVVSSPRFEKQFKRLAKKYRSLKTDFEPLAYELAENPKMGIPLGRNLYKIRLSVASKGKGKSGGMRIITYFRILAETVYVLSIYDKSEIENIDEKEIEKSLSEIEFDK
jgi:mRNA-degrading endonuclease RelE of RelBE toxin-antitoxin system